MLVQPVNHNILINPSFTVKQRGDVVDHATTSYGPDRWVVRGKSDVGGTKVESTTGVDDTTGINKLVVKHEGTTVNSAHAYQLIETINFQGLYSKEMTFSFSYSDVGGSGIPHVAISSYDSSAIAKTLFNTIPTSLGDNRWTCTFTLSTTDGTIPDPSEQGMQVAIYTNEQNNSPDKWYVWETKLEVGSVATPFIARSHGEELALCQRYYYSTEENTQIYYSAASYKLGGNSETGVVDVWFPVPMRTSPTLLPYTASSLDAKSEVITMNRARLNGAPTNMDNCSKVESSLMFDAEFS